MEVLEYRSLEIGNLPKLDSAMLGATRILALESFETLELHVFSFWVDKLDLQLEIPKFRINFESILEPFKKALFWRDRRITFLGVSSAGMSQNTSVFQCTKAQLLFFSSKFGTEAQGVLYPVHMDTLHTRAVVVSRRGVLVLRRGVAVHRQGIAVYR